MPVVATCQNEGSKKLKEAGGHNPAPPLHNFLIHEPTLKMTRKINNIIRGVWGARPPCRLAPFAILRRLSRALAFNPLQYPPRAYRQKNAISQHLKTVPRGLANV